MKQKHAVRLMSHRDVCGDVHVRAVPQRGLAAELSLGKLDRDDIIKPDSVVRSFHQTVNAGGKEVEVHTGSGRIVIR